MTALYHIIAGIIGGFISIFPVGFDSHVFFWNSVNETVAGKNTFMFGFDVAAWIYLGVVIGVFLIYRERILAVVKKVPELRYIKEINDAELWETAEVFVAVLSWLVFHICACFLENSIFVSIFLCMAVILNYFADFIKPYKTDNRKKLIILGVLSAVSAFSGLPEITALFVFALITGKKTSNAIRFAFVCSIPIFFVKFVTYFIKAVVFGFSASLWLLIPIIALAFFTSFFAVSLTKKAALKKNYKFFAYYTVIFAIVVIYTFIKG